ncbi:MAG: RNA polymerase sigma factor [Agathobacter sp.]|nr:RNA polymerase sigma factor [Agathobacter sp.]
MTEYTQEEIIDLYFKRNQRAIAVTEEMYGGRLTRFAQSMVSREDALECVNDTYLTAWRKIPPEKPGNFLAWLYKVLRNITCDRIDWNNAAKRNSSLNVMLDELAECIPDSAASFEGKYSDIGRTLSDFLRGISKEKRVMFVRRYWYGISVKELAAESGLSQSAVKTRLHRTRMELKSYLMKEGVYHE